MFQEDINLVEEIAKRIVEEAIAKATEEIKNKMKPIPIPKVTEEKKSDKGRLDYRPSRN